MRLISRGNSQYKVPEVRVCLICWKKNRQVRPGQSEQGVSERK